MKSTNKNEVVICESSPPSRGAWIEIYKDQNDEAPKTEVAPLAGGVD